MSTNDDIKRKLHLDMMGQEFQRIVREGHPSVGWRGDPWLTVAYNKLLDCFEVWSEKPGFPPAIVLRSKPGEASKRAIDAIGLAKMLAEADLRWKDIHTRVREMEEHNARVERAIEQHHEEVRTEALERVFHGLTKDIGHLY